jgi:hypothetical protein
MYFPPSQSPGRTCMIPEITGRGKKIKTKLAAVRDHLDYDRLTSSTNTFERAQSMSRRSTFFLVLSHTLHASADAKPGHGLRGAAHPAPEQEEDNGSEKDGLPSP